VFFREFKPGKVAIISRSGTLCYETVASTTKAQLGQSTVIGIGGDRMPGTSYIDALEMLADDPTTQGFIPSPLTLNIIKVDDAFIRNYINW